MTTASLASSCHDAVGIVGGGWAGMAAALELAQRGIVVHVLETAPVLGGRARRVARQHPQVAGDLDNGQHLLLGAYRHTLMLMARAGVPPEQAFLRLPLQMAYPDGWSLTAPRLPAPLHLAAMGLTARRVPWRHRLALARTLCALAGHAPEQQHQTVSAWLHGQPQPLLDRLWYPLCVAALNTPPDEADAEVFRRVLRDSLLAARADSDMLVPRMDLSRMFPEAAADIVRRAGGTVQGSTTVQQLRRQGAGWTIDTTTGSIGVGRVIVATGPRHARRLLANSADAAQATDTLRQLDAMAFAPIVTVHLNVGTLRLPRPFLALDTTPDAPAQFVFDRAALMAPATGVDNVWSVVISAADDAASLPQAELARRVRRQLAHQLAPVLETAHELEVPRGDFVIAERHATYRCRPGLQRPGNDIGVPGLLLAGDYTDGPYPATIEAATLSGSAAAALCLSDTCALAPSPSPSLSEVQV